MSADQNPSDRAGPDLPKSDVQWKRGQRRRLLRAREQLSAEFRASADTRISALLEETLPQITTRSFSFFWPMPGEPDLREAAARWYAAGATAALPDTVKGMPLTFRPWSPGCAMRPGVWNIPVPDTERTMHPSILLIPCLGFDSDGYRLGHGGGFYDRTLAERTPDAGHPPCPLAVGIAYSHAVLPSIWPEAHDIPMDMIITEKAAIRFER